MGLLDLFLQNKTTLDVEQTPTQGNGPVGTPTGEFNTGVTSFQQTWDSNKTYVNSFIGGTNVGIQPPTLKETGLDIDNPNYIPSTTTPNTLTAYPATALGGLGQSAVQFLQIWSPVINYNDVVVGAGTSPLAQSLPETGLDNTDKSSVPTTVSPINNTDYPSLATGEYNSVSNQYNQTYGPNNTYLNTYDPNVQPDSLNETGLDIENIGLVSTTISPSTNTPYPNLASGEFGGQSNNFDQIYTPNSTYLDTYNPQSQPNTVIQGQTGLDNTNPVSAPTTTPPIDPTSYPQYVQGEFNGAPVLYNQIWKPNFRYIANYNPNIQPNTLSETGLDNTDSLFNLTTTTPSTPTLYPQFAQGEFNGAPTQYSQVWGPNNQYIVNYNPNTQPDTLDETGLDVENSNTVSTTTTPSTTTQYPQFVQGEFNAAPTQYTQIWGPTNQYIISYNPNTQPNTVVNGETGLDNTNPSSLPTTTNPTSYTQYFSQYNSGKFGGTSQIFIPIYNPLPNADYLTNYNPNTQINTLDNTGLDNTNNNANATSPIPNAVSKPNDYPALVSGEFNGSPTQYNTLYSSNNTYLNTFDPNTQPNTLNETGLDNINNDSLPTSFIPDNISAPTNYGNTPSTPQVQMGEFGGAPSQYQTLYTPNNTYLSQNNLSTIISDTDNPQVLTVLDGLTGLDNIDSQASPTTFVPDIVSAPTNYPQPAQTYLGEFQGAPSQFTPLYTPNPGQSYLDNYDNIVNDTSNTQIINLSNTGLDVENSSASPTTYTVPEYDTTTVYPPQATGEYNGASTPYEQIYTPNSTYEEAIINTPSGPISILESSNQYTGLDIENRDAAPTTYVVPEVDNTIYPYVEGATLYPEASGSTQTYFSQTWKPLNSYLSFIKNQVSV
jgi:hypothetical protein